MVKSSPGVTTKPRFRPNLDSTVWPFFLLIGCVGAAFGGRAAGRGGVCGAGGRGATYTAGGRRGDTAGGRVRA